MFMMSEADKICVGLFNGKTLMNDPIVNFKSVILKKFVSIRKSKLIDSL